MLISLLLLCLQKRKFDEKVVFCDVFDVLVVLGFVVVAAVVVVFVVVVVVVAVVAVFVVVAVVVVVDCAVVAVVVAAVVVGELLLWPVHEARRRDMRIRLVALWQKDSVWWVGGAFVERDDVASDVVDDVEKIFVVPATFSFYPHQRYNTPVEDLCCSGGLAGRQES